MKMNPKTITIVAFFSAVSIVLSLLIISPDFKFRSCGINRFSDFYPIFSNPPDSNCSSEICFALRQALSPETDSPSELTATFKKLRYSRIERRQYPSATG